MRGSTPLRGTNVPHVAQKALNLFWAFCFMLITDNVLAGRYLDKRCQANVIHIKLMLKNIFYFLQENILLTAAHIYFSIVAHNNHAAFPAPVFPGMIQVNEK